MRLPPVEWTPFIRSLGWILLLGCGGGALVYLISGLPHLGVAVGGGLISGAYAVMSGFVFGAEVRYSLAHGGRIFTAPLGVLAFCAVAALALTCTLIPETETAALGAVIGVTVTLLVSGLASGLISG
jgi:hypothetical protein